MFVEHTWLMAMTEGILGTDLQSSSRELRHQEPVNCSGALFSR
jgi:hypothetical protein